VDDESRSKSKFSLDWTTLIAAMVACFGIATGLGGIFRGSLLADVDVRIASHAMAQSEWRTSIADRVSRLEQQCQDNFRWRDKIDDAIDGLQTWRTNCSTKMAGIQQYKQSDSEQVEKLATRIERLESMIHRGW